MTEPCRALRGLLEAVVREYRRICLCVIKK
jgi:hypothetical protein